VFLVVPMMGTPTILLRLASGPSPGDEAPYESAQKRPFPIRRPFPDTPTLPRYADPSPIRRPEIATE